MCKMSTQLGCEHIATRSPSKPTTHSISSAAGTQVRPRRRTHSTSSASSAASDTSNSKPEDQFVFSPHQSPGPTHPSFFASVPGVSNLSRAITQAGQHSGADSRPTPQNHDKVPQDASKPSISATSTATNSPSPHSRPIAIELPAPVTRKINSSSVYTPIEPLSGRGDIAGGYFPFHEDPNKRVHRPHPFHTDNRAPKNHIHPTEPPVDDHRPSHNLLHRPRIIKPSNSEPHGPPLKMSAQPTPMQSRSHTPVTSYVPNGLHDAHLPMGKYYPSNYEAQQRRSNQPTPNSSRPSSSAGPSSVKSDTAVPQFNRSDSSHSRSDSDAKRRLQQYQRDMVAQATQAARQIASGQGSSARLAAVHGVPVQKFHLAPHRPISPRLQPLGSPGPVTPMELEGQGGDGAYMSRGRPVPSPDAGREEDAIARAMAAEEMRMRREGRASPAVEAGGFGF